MSLRSKLRRVHRQLTRGLSRKFSLFLTLLFMGFAVSLTVANDLAQEASLRAQLTARARDLVELQARLAGVQMADLRLEDLHRTVKDLRQSEQLTQVYILDEDDLLLSDGEAGGQIFSAVSDALNEEARAQRATVLRFTSDLLQAASPVFLDAGKIGIVRIDLSLDTMHTQIRNIRLRAAAIAAGFLIAGMVVNFILIRRTTRSLKELTEQTRAAARGRFGGRLKIQSNDELKILAAAFNRMLTALDRSTVSRDYVNKVLNTVSEALVVVDTDGRVQTVNAAACRLLGYEEGDLVGRDYASLIDPTTSAARELLHGFRDRPETASNEIAYEIAPVETAYVHRNGQRVPVLISADIMADGCALVTVAQDIRVRKLAFFDIVTELPNRLSFQQMLDKAVAAAVEVDHRLALLFIDLDHFKLINDTFGHDAGDQVLKAVAERITGCIRADDVLFPVSGEPAQPLARLGGDEFILLLNELRTPEDAARVGQRIIEALSQPFDLEGRQAMVGTSIGIAICPENGTDPAILIKNADMAMYHAKRQGRNNVQFFDSRTQQGASDRLKIENELRKAVAEGTLSIFYQPQLEATTNEVVGAEALLRWPHPELGAVSPAVFVPIAEESGMIVAIGAWVLEEACRQGRKWLDEGLGAFRIAVNVSGLQLERDDFVEQVASALTRTRLPGKLLELEITEGAAVHDPERTAEKLRRLQDLGVAIAIDDFGTGYSSLSYLKRLPVNRLKIDRSFIRNLANDEADVALVEAILAMARGLKMEVIAEGVENDEQIAILRAQSCSSYQGFLASPALAAQDFVPWVLAWRRRCRQPDLAVA